MINSVAINTKELPGIRQGSPEKRVLEDLREIKKILTPREGFWVTPILLSFNTIIYVLMVLAGFGFLHFEGLDVLKVGANFGPLVKQGEWWRLFTSIFLHGGLLHLLNNLFSLWLIGTLLEPLLGRIKFATLYFVTGIIASYTSVCWHEATISVGASGAIFGLYGVLLALLLLKVFPGEMRKSFLTLISVMIVSNLLIGLTGGIDNAAHIGGLLSGFVIGLFMYPLKKNAY